MKEIYKIDTLISGGMSLIFSHQVAEILNSEEMATQLDRLKSLGRVRADLAMPYTGAPVGRNPKFHVYSYGAGMFHAFSSLAIEKIPSLREVGSKLLPIEISGIDEMFFLFVDTNAKSLVKETSKFAMWIPLAHGESIPEGLLAAEYICDDGNKAECNDIFWISRPMLDGTKKFRLFDLFVTKKFVKEWAAAGLIGARFLQV